MVLGFCSNVRLVLDQVSEAHVIPGSTTGLELGTNLFIGGHNDPRLLPWHLWTRESKFFVGCLWDIRINKQPYDLGFYARFVHC